MLSIRQSVEFVKSGHHHTWLHLATYAAAGRITYESVSQGVLRLPADLRVRDPVDPVNPVVGDVVVRAVFPWRASNALRSTGRSM